MDKIMLSIINMSFTAAFVILAVCAARLLLKKAPKVISYALWAVVAFRLLVPFSFESVFSLLPTKPQPIPQDIVYQAQPRIDSGINIIDNAVSAYLPAATPTTGSVNPIQIYIFVGTCIWLFGIAVMLIYSFVTIYLLKRRLRGAVFANDNIYEADNIKTPFVLGFIKPKIYIPSELKQEEKGYIILHEQTHIKRRDHIVKLLAYFTLCIHWFNPLVWLSFVLMSTDMELSCDEKVLRVLGTGIKKDYSASLLSLSTGRRIINGSPLAFGEGGVKTRIKNVLNFKKPSRIIIAVAVILVVALGIGLAANHKPGQSSESKLYNFTAFSVNGVTIRSDASLIDTSALTPTERFVDEYEVRFEELRYRAPDGKILKFIANVYDEGAYIPEVMFKGEMKYVPHNLKTLEQVITYLGDYGKDEWYDREQKLRSRTYDDISETRSTRTTVTFVYTDGDDGGLRHRLVWVIVDASLPGAQNLIEFEPIYSDETDYSYTLQLRRGEFLYSGYIVNGEVQSVGGVRGLTEIGFAAGSKDDKYKIYEREGYSIDEFIIVLDDGVMATPAIYIASNTAVDIEQIKVGMTVDEVHQMLGEPYGMLSGMYGDVYYIAGGAQAIIYYNYGTVETIRIFKSSGESDTILFQTDREAYNPDFINISVQLMNTDRESVLNCGESFTLQKWTGGRWQQVPFKDSIGFDGLALMLSYGDSQGFTLTPNMLDSKLDEGRYRIETNVWYESDPVVMQTLWAEFSIDKSAEAQTTFETPKDWFATTNGKDMTLEDVKTLAKKGDTLVLNDIMGYNGVNFSSSFDYQLRLINVDNGYILTVRSKADAKPDSMILSSIGDANEEGIDIRNGGIDEYVNEHPIVMHTVDGSVTPSGANVVLRNFTKNKYTYGDHYNVQRRVNDIWTDVEPVIDNYAFNDIGYSLVAQGTEEIKIDWEWLYGKLPVGDYRIIKQALFIRSPGDYDSYSLYAVFAIRD